MISIEVAQQEHSDVRKKIFDYFTKYFKAEMDKLMKDTIARCSNSEIDRIYDQDYGATFSVSFSDWLVQENFSDIMMSPLDYYSLKQLDIDFSCEEMIHIKRMYKGNYIAICKPIHIQKDGGLLVRNIVSGENIVLYPSDMELSLPKDIYHDNLLMQTIETWKGINFFCGNGAVIPSKALGILLSSYKGKSIFRNVFFSSIANRVNDYEKAQNFKNELTVYFGEHPLTFTNYDDFEKNMASFYKDNEQSSFPRSVFKGFMNFDVLPESMITFWISNEGYQIITDYPSILQSIKDYPDMKKKRQRQVLDVFVDFLECNTVPTEAVKNCIEQYPDSKDILLKDINQQYKTKFKNFNDLINYIRPFNQDPIPNIFAVPERLAPYYFGEKTEIGRNDSCLCGSEKKFKKCCGN